MLRVYDYNGSEIYSVELKKNETSFIEASAIVVLEGRFESIDVEERKFVPLVSQAKRQVTLVGCEEVNRAVVCVPKPPFSGSSSEEDFQEPRGSHEEAERRSQEEPKKRLRIERPVPEKPVDLVPPLSLVDQFGQAVLDACKKRFTDKRIVITYMESSLEGVIADIKLRTLLTVGRDKSFVMLIIGFKIGDTGFMTDHTAFAAEFRKLIKGRYRHNNLSFWQRTAILEEGPTMETLLPSSVRCFSDRKAIQKFLEA